MNIAVQRMAVGLGAEVSGVDLSHPLNDADFHAIEQAFLDHSVIFFRDQALSPDQHIAFTERFGVPEVHMMDQFNLPSHPKILVLSNKKSADGKPLGLVDAGRYWHTDVSYTERPSAASFLYALEVPPEGGDTIFASSYAAYDALPEDMKMKLTGLKGVHGLNKITAPKMTDAQFAMLKPEEHPIVRTHPATGRKAVYTGAFTLGIKDMADDEAQDLIKWLNEFCTQEKFRYRHRWRAGDLLIWDNRCVTHQATPFDTKYSRHMHRTTIEGEIPT